MPNFQLKCLFIGQIKHACLEINPRVTTLHMLHRRPDRQRCACVWRHLVVQDLSDISAEWWGIRGLTCFIALTYTVYKTFSPVSQWHLRIRLLIIWSKLYLPKLGLRN